MQIDNTERITSEVPIIEDVEFSRRKRGAPNARVISYISGRNTNAHGILRQHINNAKGPVQDPSKVAALLRHRRSPNGNVVLYVGGGDDLPMFRGCIMKPFIRHDSMHPRLLAENVQCGTQGTVCVGRPQINGCRRPEQENNEETLNGHDSALMEGPVGRAESVIQPQPIILSRDDYEPYGFDARCVLPYRAETSGHRYVGDGYSKYYVKRFNPHSWRFSLVMRTRERSGILFYMADTGCNEHIALYLVKGKLAFSVMFGGERLRLKSINRYDDEFWHHVTFERNGNVTQLMLDGSIESMGLMYNESQYFPANMPFHVGGLHVVPKKFAANQINRKHLSDFTGCIKDFNVNNQPIESLGTGAGLHIHVSPCFDGGTEPGMYFPYKEDHQPSAYMVAMSSYTVGVNVEITMDIKPRTRDGIILAVGGTTGDFFNIALVDGSLAVRLRQGGETLFTRYDSTMYGYSLCDGAWHSVKISKAKNIIALIVDENLVAPLEEGDLQNRNCNTNGALYVGGVQDGVFVEGLLTNSQYAGCIRKMRFDFRPINPSTAMSVNGDITTNICPLF